MVRVDKVEVALTEWTGALTERARKPGIHYGHLTVRRDARGERFLEVLFLSAATGAVEVVSSPIPSGSSEIPSVAASLPAAHWAERAVGDLWGLYAVGHPRWKSLLLHEAWPLDLAPFAQPTDKPIGRRDYQFMEVGGPGVHEIAVGPIHAGIIEPGHFRFSCLGEVIANLEIRLGYQHRGVEKRLAEVPWRQARHVAEAVSSDTAVANALAHAVAVEGLFGTEPPPRASAVRRIALEIERVASHLGDLGGLAGDIGFAQPSATFGRLRGAALGSGQSLSGSRFQRGFVCPSGLAFEVEDRGLSELREGIAALRPLIDDACDLFFENPGAIERMEGTGTLTRHLAEEFGVVGPAARASGVSFDARRSFSHALYPEVPVEVPHETSGDVLARARIKRREVAASLDVIEHTLTNMPSGPVLTDLPERLPASSVGVAVVESWRGSLIHWITTDEQGGIARYAVRDPSFQNWTALAIAVRQNLVADFPLINKSFGLSYSGNDL